MRDQGSRNGGGAREETSQNGGRAREEVSVTHDGGCAVPSPC